MPMNTAGLHILIFTPRINRKEDDYAKNNSYYKIGKV